MQASRMEAERPDIFAQGVQLLQLHIHANSTLVTIGAASDVFSLADNASIAADGEDRGGNLQIMTQQPRGGPSFD